MADFVSRSARAATASAAELIDAGVDERDVFVETTSFDTIGNAFFARTDHCSLAGWKRLLVITSEFHMDRTRATVWKSNFRRDN